MVEAAEVHSEAAAVDLTPAQEAELAELARTPKQMLTDVINRVAHQVNHNAPLSAGLLAELRAVAAKL